VASTLPSRSATHWPYALIGLLALIGLGLRIAAAQGGLWLDEAWSAVFAHESRSPLDIFFAIRHDNNHYLNTLWLYLTGWGAPPMLSRLFSIITGTLTIIVGGMIGLRRGPVQGVLLALLLAISPMLVTYGSEARGYAPMFLALVLAVWVTARWLDQPESRPPSSQLAAITAFGMLSHLTMLFVMVGIGLWVATALAKGRRFREWLQAMFALLGPSIILAAAILGLGVVLPLLGPDGYQVGGYTPFSLSTYWNGLAVLLEYMLGLRGPIAYAIVASLALLLPLLLDLREKDRGFLILCLAAVFTVPFLFPVAQIGNAGFGRYYAMTGFGIMLVASEVIASGLANKGWRKSIAGVALATLITGCLWISFAVIANKRGDPSRAVTAMASRAPDGATVLVASSRDVAVIDSAAASARYAARTSEERCNAAQFLFAEEPNFADLPHEVTLCGHRYAGIADGARTELSGMSWRLYIRADDQAAARRSSAVRSTS
jgi:hypothetical protein